LRESNEGEREKITIFFERPIRERSLSPLFVLSSKASSSDNKSVSSLSLASVVIATSRP